MKNLWSVPFEKDSWPHRYFVRCGDFIVCDDASDLIITHIKTGMMQRSPAEMPKDALGPSGLRAENGMLTYLASTMNYQDFNQSEKTLYKLSIPDLKIIDKKVVKVIEAVYSEKAGDLLITDALYRTACFRADGSKLWERFQLHRTPVVDGVIYFSDYHEGTARMGALDVATGKQQFFLSEKVEKNSPLWENGVHLTPSSKPPHQAAARKYSQTSPTEGLPRKPPQGSTDPENQALPWQVHRC